LVALLPWPGLGSGRDGGTNVGGTPSLKTAGDDGDDGGGGSGLAATCRNHESSVRSLIHADGCGGCDGCAECRSQAGSVAHLSSELDLVR